MKKLPIGIQTFSEIITGDYYYVDKTRILAGFVNAGKYFFLSRPRRFGKSLFLDTLREAFLGNKKLFHGLFLENNWDWSKKHPVIKIDFGGGVIQERMHLDKAIHEILNEHAKYESIELQNETISGRFRELIMNLEKKYNSNVVILVDEYDKPILDNITNKEIAKEMRDGLRNLYSVIKGADAYIKFVFITGVSKFSKVNLFSGLNNLQDITLDERYATICGYTENDLSIFEDRLINVDRNELKLWYNGYNFLGDSVYNPFDILLYLDRKQFKNYWFETGNPSFLIDLIRENNYNPIDIENIEISEEELGAFDVDNIELEVLLFQTGYLTIKDIKSFPGENVFVLTYPNLEVKKSLTSVILNYLLNTGSKSNKIRFSLYETLQTNDLNRLKDVFYSFFSSIPHDWYRKNQLANYEGYYASIFYCYFTALGLDVRPEDVTNQGQVDMTVFFDNKIYVLEFKVIEMTESGSALAQIKKKRYYEKYINTNTIGPDFKPDPTKEIYLIGVEFSKDNRNITNFEWEKLKGNREKHELSV
jgi:hypothetical protein